MLLHVEEVLHVRDCALVELFRIALLDDQPEITVVVRQHDDVPPRRLTAGQQGLDLVVEGLVVVDVLGVGDMSAVLLLEGDEGRERVLFLVHVHVVRPVGEVERLPKLLRRRAGGRASGSSTASARSKQAGQGEDRAARCRAAEKSLPGDGIIHGAPSYSSTTNVLSGLQPSVSRSPVAT